MIRLLVHQAILKKEPNHLQMHSYYKDNFDHDPALMFGTEGYADEANRMLSLLCPKRNVYSVQVDENVRQTFDFLDAKTQGYLACA